MKLRLISTALLLCAATTFAKLPVLIVDGRNNHDWKTTTESLRATLESAGRFEVAVSTAPEDKVPPLPRPKVEDATYLEAKQQRDALVKSLAPEMNAAWAKWQPDFSKYAAVVLDYNGQTWPEPMRNAFVEYVRGGGGVLLIHAANNSFPNWSEFNEMIGLGWRKAGFGVALTIDPATGAAVECCADEGSSHGAKHAFVVTTRQPGHPVLHGFPAEWLHAQDELYHHMRGPAHGVTILASAFSDPQQRGSGRHEPVLWETAFGKGRVLTCSLGHAWLGDQEHDGVKCVDFQTLVARGAEYVATGKVTLALPADFPTKEKTSIVEPAAVKWPGKPSLGAQEPALDWKAKKAANEFAVLTPEEERASFVLPEGLVAECVASEPLVQEPVLAVWGGDGAMYVAEMRSYMQDETGAGTKTSHNGRIVRLTSSKGDGIMDKATVFVDGLNLPRAILPLDGRIAITETDSTSVWSYRDTDGDGVADEKVQLFKGREVDPTQSVEHQDSGLDWNLDNWIYVTYGRERYRFTDGTWKAEPTIGIWTQWGLTHDDTGRVFFSDNSTPAMGYELPRHYWNLVQKHTGERAHGDEPISLGLPWDPSFLSAKNLCPRDDRGGKTTPRKAFTSICGQSVFRGTALPREARGDYFFCDPTIHVVRQAKLENRNGKLNFTSTYGTEEFLVSPDIYFRPVNTATGPDGCLYVVDMYRGIIQDAPWLDAGPRKFIKESGLAAVHQNGRIWRIRAKDAQPGAAPKMLGEKTSELVHHLENANGWWRDTAQRLILLRPDRESVAPQLAEKARSHKDPLARLHALWTLEGMNRAEPAWLQASWKDTDPRVRAAAIRLTEPQLAKNDAATIDGVTALAQTERDPEVAKQLILSLGCSMDARVIPAIDALTERFLAHEGVFLAATVVSWKKPTPFLARIQSGEAFNAIADPSARVEIAARWTKGLAQWNRGLKLPATMAPEQRGLITRGEETYFQICVSCHGPDGKGTAVPGREQLLAPALAGSARVRGPAAGFIPVLINGLLGPIEGKTYEGAMMVPAIALGITRDDRLAEVLSYIRYAWGNETPAVTKDEVAGFRKQHAARPTPWSDDELKAQARQATQQ